MRTRVAAKASAAPAKTRRAGRRAINAMQQDKQWDRLTRVDVPRRADAKWQNEVQDKEDEGSNVQPIELRASNRLDPNHGSQPGHPKRNHDNICRDIVGMNGCKPMDRFFSGAVPNDSALRRCQFLRY